MQVELQAEHEWLQQLVGEWTSEAVATMAPDQPAENFTGSEVVRSLGGAWVVCEGTGEMPGGGTATTILSLGYDPAKQRFVGSFIGSMMTHQWIYEGQLADQKLTLDTTGPDFSTPGAYTKYQDIIELKGPDHRTLTSLMLMPDGSWSTVVNVSYRRKK